MSRPWIETWTGRQIFFDELSSADVVLADIAHALAMTNRYNGHTLFPYSVAQHSVLIAEWVFAKTSDPWAALDALLHDATEAYLGDITRPLKQVMWLYGMLEATLDTRIRQVFLPAGALPSSPSIVKQADKRILLDERAVLQPYSKNMWGVDSLEPLGVTIAEWTAEQAELKYLAAWEAFTTMITRKNTPC